MENQESLRQQVKINPNYEYKCYHCKEIIPKDCLFLFNTSKNVDKPNIVKVHEKCLEEIKQAKKEKELFDKIYDFFRYKILKYKQGELLPKHFVNRIQSLRFGEYVIKGVKEVRPYDYMTIYKALLLSEIPMTKALNNKNDWVDEKHKIDYLMVILVDQLKVVQEMDRKRETANNTMDIVLKNIASNDSNQAQYVNRNQERNVVRDLLQDLF